MSKNLYAERNPEEQGGYYAAHVSAMTGEGLHSKSAIAAELAHRDILIDELKAQVERLRETTYAARIDWGVTPNAKLLSALHETPAQSMAEIRAEAIEEFKAELMECTLLRISIIYRPLIESVCAAATDRIRKGDT